MSSGGMGFCRPNLLINPALEQLAVLLVCLEEGKEALVLVFPYMRLMVPEFQHYRNTGSRK